MKRKIKFLVYPLAVILMSFLIITSCSDDDPEPTALFVLTLEVNPENAGIAAESGEYFEGEEVEISANANHNWRFTNWSGATQYADDPNFGNTTIKMPADDITLTANFEEKSIVYGEGVTDIDGNEYVTVIIGDQEWMAENLRVTKYSNGDAILTGLNDTEWGNTSEGAYAIYPHDSIDGFDSYAEVVSAYGKLYNWYAVDDPRGLCPEGWHVPTRDEWDKLLYYYASPIYNSASIALKSCRQVHSFQGGGCNTSEHPRWEPDDTHYGIDEFGFAALPGGSRHVTGSYYSIGETGIWWTSTQSGGTDVLGAAKAMFHDDCPHVPPGSSTISSVGFLGYSIRCIKDIE